MEVLRELLRRTFVRKHNSEIDLAGTDESIPIRSHATKDVAILIIGNPIACRSLLVKKSPLSMR